MAALPLAGRWRTVWCLQGKRLLVHRAPTDIPSYENIDISCVLDGADATCPAL
jgi:hypothetical protein